MRYQNKYVYIISVIYMMTRGMMNCPGKPMKSNLSRAMVIFFIEKSYTSEIGYTT